jgi:hypothetical protein
VVRGSTTAVATIRVRAEVRWLLLSRAAAGRYPVVSLRRSVHRALGGRSRRLRLPARQWCGPHRAVKTTPACPGCADRKSGRLAPVARVAVTGIAAVLVALDTWSSGSHGAPDDDATVLLRAAGVRHAPARRPARHRAPPAQRRDPPARGRGTGSDTARGGRHPSAQPGRPGAGPRGGPPHGRRAAHRGAGTIATTDDSGRSPKRGAAWSWAGAEGTRTPVFVAAGPRSVGADGAVAGRQPDQYMTNPADTFRSSPVTFFAR